MNTLETEIIEPSNAVALRPSSPPPALFGTNEPCEIVARATSVADSLKAVIKKQGLISNIQGKEYPRCEAWTLLGTMLGVFPVCVWTKQVDQGWEARVEARTRDGSILGAAEAQCLRSEKNWSNRDDFALRSMAQTRATAKALRMPLGFVMTLAGFEATPSEEMDNHATIRPVEPRFTPKPTLPTQTVKTPPSPTVAPAKANLATAATPEQKAKMIATIESEGPDAVQRALRYFIEAGALLPNEILTDLPNHWIPYTQAQFRELGLLIAKMSETDRAERPAWVRLQPKGDPNYADPHHATADTQKIVEQGRNLASSFNPEEEENPFNEPEPAKEAPKTAQQPELTANDETWRSYLTPWGKNAGVRLDKLPKNTLWGFWKNHTVETEYKGKPIAPEKIAKAQEFRDMLDASGRHYQFTDT